MPSAPVKRWIGAVVEKRHVRPAAEPLGHDAGEDVDLVVIGERHERVGVLDVRLAEDLLVEGTAVEDHRPPELVGDRRSRARAMLR